MEKPNDCPSETPKPSIDSLSEDAPSSKWCDIPEAILFKIALLLNCRTNIARLRAVCPAWRSKLPSSKFPTMITLPIPPIKPNLPKDPIFLFQRFYLFTPNTPHHDEGPLGGRWVARMAELGPNRKNLSNPLNIHQYFFSDPYISGSVDPLECSIEELECVFTIMSKAQRKAEPLSKKTVHSMDENSSYVLAVLAQLERGEGLFLYRFGEEWVDVLQGSDTVRVIDIACQEHKFYAFDLAGWRVGVIDPASPSVAMEFIHAPGALGDPIDDMYTVVFDECQYFLKDCHLVPTDGGLYLVVMVGKVSDESRKKASMFVFVLKGEGNKQEGYKWERVKSLNDRIFFIGYDVSFALNSASKNLPQWKPNTICLFTRPFPMLFDGCYKEFKEKMPKGVEPLDSVTYARYWLYFSMFNLDEEDEGIVPFKKLPKKLYTGLFFPPPGWVKWTCPSRDNVEVRLDGLKFVDLGDRPFED